MRISVRNLHFAYRRTLSADSAGPHVLSGVSLEIGSGEHVAIIGQNGSGKTTLAKHLNGLLRPVAGDVVIGDWNTREHTVAQLARRVGLVFQNADDQILKQRVVDEVAFGLRCVRLSQSEIETRVAHALERAQLVGLGAAHPYDLLPSQRKWVSIASVLAMDTPVLVLDEPTAGQDARELERLGALLGDLARAGKTIVTITHDMDWCAEHCDRIVVMQQGQVRADGDPHHVFAETGLLAGALVAPPQITRLARALHLPQTPVTIDEFLTAVTRP